MSLASINIEIQAQYDHHTEAKLKDIFLNNRYANMPATKAIRVKVDDLVKKLEIDKRGERLMLKTLMPLLTPPSVKASVRGLAFNEYINGVITRFMNTRGSKMGYRASFEETHCDVHEKPDWILRTPCGKTIIGYNQLDLWNGGAQLNRASKYIMDEGLHARLRKKSIFILCVVARKLVLTSRKNKVNTMICKGLRTQRLMWPKGLRTYLETLVNGHKARTQRLMKVRR